MSQSLLSLDLNRLTAGAAVRSRLAAADWRSIAAFSLPFSLYLLTLAPTVYNLDSAEFTTAAATGGLVRATGYPLYLLIGRAWTLLPIGDVGYRMNLLSAVAGALTLLLADRILRKLEVGQWASLGALGLLATAPFFWALSLIAEVYTVHTALMAGLILLLLRWAEEPTPRRLAWVGLVGGLSMGHHAATVLLVPGAVWYVLAVAPRRALAPRALLATGAATLLGLSVYLYLPLVHAQDPAFNYAGHYDATGTFVPLDLSSVSGLWWLITGQSFAGEMLAYSGAALWREIGHFLVQLWQAFFGVGLGPGLLGLAVLLRPARGSNRHLGWRFGVMLLLMFLFSAGFYVDYRVVDKDTMFLPTYLVWALWSGMGLSTLLDWIRRSEAPEIGRAGLGLLRAGILIVVLTSAAWNWRLADLSDDQSARQRGEEILNRVEPDALVFGWWDTVPVIEYLQLVESQRPDVQAINRFLIDHDDMEHLIRAEVVHRPVYVQDPPARLQRSLGARPAGALYRLDPAVDGGSLSPNP